MENNATAKNFINNEVLKIENRLFWGRILSLSIGYTITTPWLNSIRDSASLWLVWPLIIIQFALYFSIFISCYQRSLIFGLNYTFAFILFLFLCVLGRNNNWDLLVIPSLVIVMLTFSTTNKTTHKERQQLLNHKEIRPKDMPRWQWEEKQNKK